MQAGDTLVLNDTRVLPARLVGAKTDTGARAELLLLKQLTGDRWETLAKPGKRLKVGAEISFGDNGKGEPLLTATVVAEGEMGVREVEFQYIGIFQELLDRLGDMPLPPYIKERLDDRERYQTVYARHEGSAAAPTAGLHFTQDFLEQLSQKGAPYCLCDTSCGTRYISTYVSGTNQKSIRCIQNIMSSVRRRPHC